MMMNPKKSDAIRFVFFGTGEIAKIALQELLQSNFVPALVVTAPDKPRGRGLESVPTAVASFAAEHNLPISKAQKLDNEFLSDLRETSCDLFVVVDYGALLPQALLDIPERGTLNMHPSLLPRLRGPSPIRTAILNDEKEVGVSIMLVDEKMDHGPIVAQRKITIANWPPLGRTLDTLLAHEGGRLLAEILPLWVAGEIIAQPQNHDIATVSKRFKKEDGLLDLEGNARANYLKIRAFDGWPGTYTFSERNGKRIRVQIIDAELQGEKLVIKTVKPEGKKEMAYADFVRTNAPLI